MKFFGRTIASWTRRPQTEWIAAEFRIRALYLNCFAAAILFVILALLGGGVYVFFKAPSITHQDVSALRLDTPLSKIFYEKREQFSTLLNKVGAQLLDLVQFAPEPDRPVVQKAGVGCKAFAEKIKILSVADISKTHPDDMFKLLEFTDVTTKNTELEKALIDLKGTLVPAIGELAKAASDLATELNISKADADSSPKDDIYFFASTQITRFGTLTVVIFLVSILVNLYRYNIRLSAYYNARGDAIVMMGVSPDQPADIAEFGQLVRELSPEAYDFGKMPKSPAEYAVDLAKAMIEKLPVKPGG